MRMDAMELWADWTVTDPLRLPFHAGSLLRGAIGRALRRVGCARTPACAQACAAPGRCAYSRLFDPPPPGGIGSEGTTAIAATAPRHPLLSATTRSPAPLVPIFPPPGATSLGAGDRLRLGFRLLGHAADDAERLRAALGAIEELALGRDRGRLALAEVVERCSPGMIIEVPSTPPATGEAAGDAMEGRPDPVCETVRRRLAITFDTPAWLERNGRLDTSLDFVSLFTSAWRRLTTLALLYGDWSPDDDATFARLRPHAQAVRTTARRLRVLTWERRSDAGGQQHPMRGLLGEMTCEGPMDAFLPLLRAAALVHVGKSTSFGLGRFAWRME